MILFGKEDIEKMGFQYEPDKSKCKVAKTKAYYGSIDVWDEGKSVERHTIMTSDEYNPKEYKVLVAQTCPFLHVYSFEIPDEVPVIDGHWDVWVCVRGHTPKLEVNLIMEAVKNEEIAKKVISLMQDTMMFRQIQVDGTPYFRPEDVKSMMEESFMWGFEAGNNVK